MRGLGSGQIQHGLSEQPLSICGRVLQLGLCEPLTEAGVAVSFSVASVNNPSRLQLGLCEPITEAGVAVSPARWNGHDWDT